MGTQITEIAPNIYRLSTYVADSDLMYNQFLVVDDEPVLFQTGLRKLFPLVLDAVGRLIPVERLRWISFGHLKVDECGSMNQWLAASPNAQVAQAEVHHCGRSLMRAAIAARLAVTVVPDRHRWPFGIWDGPAGAHRFAGSHARIQQ